MVGRGATRARRGEAAILLLACRRILRRAFICKTLACLVSSSRAAPIIASSSASLQGVRDTLHDAQVRCVPPSAWHMAHLGIAHYRATLHSSAPTHPPMHPSIHLDPPAWLARQSAASIGRGAQSAPAFAA